MLKVSRKKSFAVVSILLCLFLILTGCVKGEGGEPTSKSKETTLPGTEESISTGKYDPPITLKTIIYDRGEDSHRPGETADNNIWLKTIEEELGIKVDVIWSGSYSDSWREVALYMASGNLPDMFYAYAEQFAQLVEDDAITDLTDVYEQYASPRLKELLSKNEAAVAMKGSMRNGKLYAIPSAANTTRSANTMAIRYDWLKNLNLPDPETMEDLLDIIKAFTYNDPDGNGEDDTFGLIANDMLFPTSAISLRGFANGYHAYPRIWFDDGSGQLIFGSIQPEMKQVLQVLQDLYKTGQMDNEIYTLGKGSGDARDTALAGKGGVVFGTTTYVTGAFQPLVEEDPSIDWRIYPIVSIDDRPARPQVDVPVYEFFHVVRKDYPHPEAIIKLANFYVEAIFPEDLKDRREELYSYVEIKDGREVVTNLTGEAPIWIGNVEHDYANWLKISGRIPFEPEDYEMESLVKSREAIEAYENGDITNWSTYMSNGPEYSYNAAHYYYATVLNDYVYDMVVGSPSITWVQKEEELYDMMRDCENNIVAGEWQIDEFDKFVEEWLKRGGEDVIKEVNDWYKTIK